MEDPVKDPEQEKWKRNGIQPITRMVEESIIKEEDRFHEAEGTAFDSAVCPGCGCLCEDIDLTLNDDNVIQTFHACSWGLSKFHRGHRFLREPKHAKLVFPTRKDAGGRPLPISYEEGYEKAAEILKNAKRVIFFGVCQSTFEAQLEAISLLKKLKALLYPSEGMLLTPYFKALKTQDTGIATLEEIRQLATTLLFWGANPLHSCPRLVTRYAVFASGINAPDRHINRKVFYADPYENDTGSFAQHIPVEPDRELEKVRILTEIIEEGAFTFPKDLAPLIQAIEASPFVALFVGRGVAYSTDPGNLMEALFKLRHAIARKTPCVLLPIISDFNAMGLYLALHQSGIDPSRSPQVQGDLLHYHPNSGDALLCIGSDPFWFFSDTQIEAIRASDLPVIALSALQNQTTHAADLVLPVALSGVEAEGLAFRMDGIPIYLRKILPTAQPTDRAVLRALSQNLGGDPFHG